MKYLLLFLLIALVSAGGNNNGDDCNGNKGGNKGGNKNKGDLGGNNKGDGCNGNKGGCNENKGGCNGNKGGCNGNKGGCGGNKGGCGGNKNGNHERGPVDSCDKQSECLNTKITQVGDEYEICVWWDSSLSNCRKGSMDSISHVCYGKTESDKKEGCNSGETHKICRIVACDNYGSFGLKDGAQCEANEDGSLQKAYGFSGVEGIICKAGTQGGMCGGGAKKDCVWYIPAPECEDPNPTETPNVVNEETTNAPATTDGPCIRDIDSGDLCSLTGDGITEDDCEAVYEGWKKEGDGCAWVDGSCTRACGFYAGIECDNQCGCMSIGEATCILDSAPSAGAMRIDEYVVEDEYDAIDEDDNNGNESGEWIKGVNNMYLFIGVGVIGLLLIVFVGCIACILIKKKKYVEMKDEQEIQNAMNDIQMNEIEVDGGQNMISTR